MACVYEPSVSGVLPREKLILRGAQSLSDLDLFRLILGSGCKKAPLETLAQRACEVFDRWGYEPSESAFRGVPGLGPAKVAQLSAVFELIRRVSRPAHLKITGPQDLVPRLRHWADRPQEVFLAVTLNGAHELLNIHPVTLGLLNRTLIHPREVFAPAITDRAASLILSHTHPSGSLEPSKEDRDATSRLAQAGKLLGIEVLDHLILTTSGYYSFRENGELSL